MKKSKIITTLLGAKIKDIFFNPISEYFRIIINLKVINKYIDFVIDKYAHTELYTEIMRIYEKRNRKQEDRSNPKD